MTRNPLRAALACALMSALPLFVAAYAGTESYTYDALGRVTSVTHASGATETYTYDAAGNRTKTVRTAAS